MKKRNPILNFKKKSSKSPLSTTPIKYLFDEGLSYFTSGILVIEKAHKMNNGMRTMITETREQIDTTETS
jgi:hypothetical protein